MASGKEIEAGRTIHTCLHETSDCGVLDSDGARRFDWRFGGNAAAAIPTVPTIYI
jgi:hypothetical protein